MKTMLTRDHLAVWLAAIHADAELDAHAFKIAFALSRAADPVGFIKIARTNDTGGPEAVADVLGRLAARGHLEACGPGQNQRISYHRSNRKRDTASRREGRKHCTVSNGSPQPIYL